MRKNLLILILILLVYNTTLMANPMQSLRSPNNMIELVINQGPKHITAIIKYKDKTVIPEIRFGLQEQNQTFHDNIKCLGFSKKAVIHEQYTAIHGKRSFCSNNGNTFIMNLENSQKKKLDIEFRVYNDGVCFRYVLSDSQTDSLRFINEFTTYRIHQEADHWMQKYIPHYEGDFPHERGNISQGEWGYPALVHYNNCWALLTEANNNRNYCATHLTNVNHNELYEVTYPHKEEGNGIGSTYSTALSPWTSPWRVIILGELKNIVESTLVEDVSDPCLLTETDWIQPGPASWIYWAYNHGTKDYKTCCEYVDLAATMHWKYVLFDWEWDQMQNGGTLSDAARYATSKGIKPLIWYNSGGKHNRVLSTPRDRLITTENRNREFKRLKEMGFSGIKVDFFESDKQHMINYYLDILEDAAKHKLMVNFHGCTLPRGWSRTYPHLMSMEAVYGAEQYNNSSYMTTAAARLNSTYPFTRNVVGPMDYTPVAFTNSQHPHHTSNTHELALSVIFESGIQHWADRPEGFYQLSDEAKSFMSTVPVAWDDTRFIEGFPGKYIVLARRKGTTWYLAGINGTDSHGKLCISLDFLQDTDYQMVLFSDGKENSQIRSQHKQVSRTDSIEIEWKAEGGFVACLKCNSN